MTSQIGTSSLRRRGYPKGRDVAPVALAALRGLLGDERLTPSLQQRDLLIEHLHAIQEAHGYLALVELRALAAYMNLPMAAVYETATFYAHFDVVHDHQAPPPIPLSAYVIHSHANWQEPRRYTARSLLASILSVCGWCVPLAWGAAIRHPWLK
ncbi:NAD(P)H-dependent oxidoreductase subunit E [Halomonas sp. LY9]